jgi:hypothetical protein
MCRINPVDDWKWQPSRPADLGFMLLFATFEIMIVGALCSSRAAARPVNPPIGGWRNIAITLTDLRRGCPKPQ